DSEHTILISNSLGFLSQDFECSLSIALNTLNKIGVAFCAPVISGTPSPLKFPTQTPTVYFSLKPIDQASFPSYFG
ncbi:MAG: hypothetical protein ACPGVH_08445, partial [Chitinophagales bacterium]